MSSPINLSADAREDFRDAIARHRRTAWRVGAVCNLAYAVLGLVAALGLAPLLYGVIGVVLDALNGVFRTPNLLHYAAQELDSTALTHATVTHRIWLGAIAALPGIVLLTIAARLLRRAFLHSPLFRADAPVGRPAMAADLHEAQLVHTVEEMAVAAGIPLPRVAFLAGSVNGASFGTNAACATVLIGTDMGPALTRSQMQAVNAHLVAAIANGDMAIGLRTACIVGVFSLTHRLGMEVLANIDNREAFRQTLRLLRAFFLPTSAGASLILSELSASGARVRSPTPTIAGSRMTWREWLLMPLLAPVFFNGLFAGIISSTVLIPLVNLAWRQRKYMADATAVRLTRDPDALDAALVGIVSANSSVQMPAWANHLCIVDPRSPGKENLLQKSWIAIFPPLICRHRALLRLGASERAVRGSFTADSLSLRITRAILMSLYAIAGVFVVGAIACAYCLSLIATLFPIVILHGILR